MSIEFVVGGLGDGKSLYCVSKLKQYLADGKKVATNYNINLEALCNPNNKHARVIRVPDSPSQNDFRAIGLGSELSGDKNNGLLLLDELGTWFNARDFGNKERQKVLKYCIHLRKKRWDVMFIVQDFSMVDKQLRGGMTTYLTSCRSSHKGWGLLKCFPKFHYAVRRNKERVHVGTDYLFPVESKKLYPVYDTEQLFNCAEDFDEDDQFGDPELKEREAHYIANNGLYCYLPPGYSLTEEIRQEKLVKKKMPLTSYALAASVVLSSYLLLTRNSEASSVAEIPAVDPVATGAQTVLADALPGQVPDAIVIEPVDPFLFRFETYRIRSYANFGGQITYGFDDGFGQRVSQQSLINEGYQVKARGKSEALIIDPENRFVSVH